MTPTVDVRPGSRHSSVLTTVGGKGTNVQWLSFYLVMYFVTLKVFVSRHKRGLFKTKSKTFINSWITYGPYHVLSVLRFSLGHHRHIRLSMLCLTSLRLCTQICFSMSFSLYPLNPLSENNIFPLIWFSKIWWRNKIDLFKWIIMSTWPRNPLRYREIRPYFVCYKLNMYIQS